MDGSFKRHDGERYARASADRANHQDFDRELGAHVVTADYDEDRYRVPKPKKDATGGVVRAIVLVLLLAAAGAGAYEYMRQGPHPLTPQIEQPTPEVDRLINPAAQNPAPLDAPPAIESETGAAPATDASPTVTLDEPADIPAPTPAPPASSPSTSTPPSTLQSPAPTTAESSGL